MVKPDDGGRVGEKRKGRRDHCDALELSCLPLRSYYRSPVLRKKGGGVTKGEGNELDKAVVLPAEL